jgi:hypothetical protein
MVLRLRGSARTVSAVLVVLSLWSLPHRSQPDICVPAGFEEHDESKHVYTAPSQAAHEDHCAVCHWMRSLKPAFASSPYAAADADSSAAFFIQPRDTRRQSALRAIPPRAPPAR